MYRKQIDTTEELAAWYDTKYLEMNDGWYTPPEESNRHLDDLGVPYDKNRWLLDVGCGAGHFLAEAEKRVNCTGIDISDIAIGFAAKRATGSRLYQHSIEKDLDPCGFPYNVKTYDYITSIGSLEHIVDIDKALDNIRKLLKPTGKWYFYCPNERWTHEDQPNERTYTDEEWKALFERHGLHVLWSRRWGANQDNTAFSGQRDDVPQGTGFVIPVHCKINAGSGQRPFDKKEGWVNIDIQERWQPDLVADWNNLSMFPDNSVDMVVSHHSLEHVGCGEADPFIREAHRILRPNGRFLIFIPDLRALAQHWLTRQIDDYIYIVNLMGAYMGDEHDRHKWHYTYESLRETLSKNVQWDRIMTFNWRHIPGADIARDFWIMGTEAIK